LWSTAGSSPRLAGIVRVGRPTSDFFGYMASQVSIQL
jgi:hypothetical protein